MTPRRHHFLISVLAASLGLSCYSAGDGTDPPSKSFYFPVGVTVSRGGSVMYVVNSDFDLQWNGGTVQSYDLELIRRHAVLAIKDPTDPALPLLRPGVKGECPSNPPISQSNGSGFRQPLGETCAPPVDSTVYVRDSVIIGAFATDLQLSQSSTRLFMPVRGDASLTWIDVQPDDPNVVPPTDPTASYAPWTLDCGVRVNNRCDGAHHAGNNPDEPNNTRKIAMPGEPFGMAQSEDGTAITITHQNDTKTSLLSTGLPPCTMVSGNVTCASGPPATPALQFVVDGLPVGGNGIAAIPHDPLASAGTAPPRPAFLQTSRSTAELDLLRYYSDQGSATQSSLLRPYLVKESTFGLAASAGGSDSRGIVIDPTPRLACQGSVPPADPGARPPRSDADVERDMIDCARLPARVFFANRTPASMLLGEIGEPAAAGDGTYDPDRLVIFGNIPLSVGPSRLYLAPIVDQDGNYALRVFIVCFDSALLFVYDPEAHAVENIIHVGGGPFAMGFDPFSMKDVAMHAHVPQEMPNGQPDLDLKKYRFAYIASFTNSFMQVIDLDNSRIDKSTFENVVLTLSEPTTPRGSQ
ncbi:MAG: hypothetical protein ABIP89_01605 [Polyangiaceae bacterium]